MIKVPNKKVIWKHLAAGVMADVRLYTLPMTKHIFVTPEERQQEPN